MSLGASGGLNLTPGPCPKGKGRHGGDRPPLSSREDGRYASPHENLPLSAHPPPLLLTADWVLPITAPPIRDGAVLVVGERIRAVGPRRSVEAPHNTAHRHYDGAAILPGLVNLHTHLEYTGLGPLPERQPFWEWMPALIRRSQQAPLDFWPASASAGAERLVAAGTTCVGDVVTFGPGLTAAQTHNLAGISFVEAVGMRARERLDEQLTALSARLERSVRLMRGSRRLRVGLGPHTIYTLSTAALERLAALAQARNLPLTIHLAETAAEVELSHSGQGLLAERLTTMGGHDLIEMGGCGTGPALLADRCGLFEGLSTRRPAVVAHGVHLDDGEIARLAARDVAVALCPRSNAGLHCGAAPIQRLVEHGVRLGLGTDSLASNEGLDLFAEAAAAYALWQRQAGAAFDPRAAARRILRWLTIEGAQALGLERELGSVTVGKYADLAVVALPRPGDADLAEQLCTGVLATAVRCTVVAGSTVHSGTP